MTDPPRGSNISAVRTQSWFSARSCIRSSMVAPDNSGVPDRKVRVGCPAVCDSMVRKVRVPGAGGRAGRKAGSPAPTTTTTTPPPVLRPGWPQGGHPPSSSDQLLGLGQGVAQDLLHLVEVLLPADQRRRDVHD